MRFLFIGLSPTCPSTRYRLLQYVPYLQWQNIKVRVVTIPPKHTERANLFSTIEADEAVVLQKKLFSFWDLRLLLKKTRKLVYDFDDAVMYPDSFSWKKHSLTRKKRFKRTISAAHTIIAGNEYLKEKVEALGAKAMVIPTPVDTDVYSPGKAKEGDGIILGWLGSDSTLPYLERLVPVLQQVAALNPGLKLKVVCNRSLTGNSLNMENKLWSLEEEVEDLRSFHIGLMPLSDDLWARGKCGFKLLQYMAVGVPGVASAVGVNSQIIKDAVNGFLARDEKEWITKLNILINQSELRKEMGEKARRTVEEKYSLAVNAPLFLDAILKCHQADY